MEIREKEISGKLEELEALTQSYLAQTTEPQFREYLQTMLQRIRAQQHQTALLQNELSRSYTMYKKRMELAGTPVAETAIAVTPESSSNVSESNAGVPESTVVGAENQEPRIAEAVNVTEPDTSRYITEVLPEEKFSTDTSMEQPASVVYQAEPTPVNVAPVAEKRSAEFVIGTALLSILGGAFILWALVMLGMHFMTGFLKGMCLYAASGAVLAVSELLVYKRWEKLGKVFTSIAIGGLYLSTVINCVTLENFNEWVAIGITVAITVGVVLLSRKRDSFFYRILGLIAGYLCVLPMHSDVSDMGLVVMSVVLLLINITCIVVPIQRYKTAFYRVHIIANSLLAAIIWMVTEEGEVSEWAFAIFVVCAYIVMQWLYAAHIRYLRKDQMRYEESADTSISIYYIAGAFLLLPVTFVVESMSSIGDLHFHGSMIAFGIMALLTTCLLPRGKGKWHPYNLVNIFAIIIYMNVGYTWEFVSCLLILYVLCKAISLFQERGLRFLDVLLTGLVCWLCIWYADRSEWYTYVLAIAVLLSILTIHYLQTVFAIMITVSLAGFAAIQLPAVLELQSAVGILFVGMLLFNNVNRWKDRYVGIYNAFMLVGQIICFAQLMNPVYQNEYLIYFCMLVFGTATIVIMFQEKYRMNFSQKHLILALFLTYMSVVVKTDVPIVNSILMMLIALVCVGLGFGVKKKSIRIYGLVLSLLVCGKIVLYDYFDAPVLQKTILLFAIGVIALMIAGIYIVLEKRTLKDSGEVQ